MWYNKDTKEREVIKMFPTWFVNVFNVCFYIGLPILLVYGIIVTWKDFKWSLENPVEYEDEIEEEETV